MSLKSCTSFACTQASGVIVNCRNCLTTLHKQCAKGTSSHRCQQCYNKKERASAKCSFPGCTVTDISLDTQCCYSKNCTNRLHHMCLSGSKFPAEYTEADNGKGFCFACIKRKLRGSTISRVNVEWDEVRALDFVGQGVDPTRTVVASTPSKQPVKPANPAKPDPVEKEPIAVPATTPPQAQSSTPSPAPPPPPPPPPTPQPEDPSTRE